MVFHRQGCVAKSSTKVTTLPPVSRLALTLKSSFSLAHLFFNGLLRLGPESRLAALLREAWSGGVVVAGPSGTDRGIFR